MSVRNLVDRPTVVANLGAWPGSCRSINSSSVLNILASRSDRTIADEGPSHLAAPCCSVASASISHVAQLSALQAGKIGRWRVRRSAGNSSTVDANAAKRCRPHDSRGARHSRGERRVHQASLDDDATRHGTCQWMDMVPHLAFHGCARYDLGAVR